MPWWRVVGIGSNSLNWKMAENEDRTPHGNARTEMETTIFREEKPPKELLVI